MSSAPTSACVVLRGRPGELNCAVAAITGGEVPNQEDDGRQVTRRVGAMPLSTDQLVADSDEAFLSDAPDRSPMLASLRRGVFLRHPMVRLLLVRLGSGVLVMLNDSFMTTLLAGLIPRSPTSAIYGAVPASFADSWNQSHGLNNSLLHQYGHWLSGVFHGDLGTSWSTAGAQTVGFLLRQRIEVTAEIAVGSLVVSLLIAIPAAMIAATRPGGFLDHIINTVSSFCAAVPPFVTGVFLISLFSVEWQLLPSQGFVDIQDGLGKNFQYMILPVITVSLHIAPFFVRVLRGDLVSILSSEFVSAARSRGIPEWYVMTRYVLRPASAVLITVAGLSFGALLGGSIVVEVFYNIPGLGNLAYISVKDKDIPVLQGIVVFVALFFVVINTAVDLLYRVLDPRVRITS